MEMAEERGVKVSHTSIYRWVIKFTPDIEAAVRRARKTTGNSWFADETYIKVNGRWKYLYRAVDQAGQTVDYLLTARRDMKAARRFFRKAIGTSGVTLRLSEEYIPSLRSAFF